MLSLRSLSWGGVAAAIEVADAADGDAADPADSAVASRAKWALGPVVSYGVQVLVTSEEVKLCVILTVQKERAFLADCHCVRTVPWGTVDST